MDIKSWCEYVRDVMDHFHLSNTFVAEKAESSVKTIERIRTASIDQDIMRGTARRVELVVFGSAGNLTCHLDHDPTAATELIAQLRAEVEYWRKENDRKARIIDKYLE